MTRFRIFQAVVFTEINEKLHKSKRQDGDSRGEISLNLVFVLL